MKKEQRRLRKVSVKDVEKNYEMLMAAAREGRLFVAPKGEAVTRREVVENVRRYVAQIDGCASRQYRDRISLLWDVILGKEEFVDMLMPDYRAIKFRLFNKYGVMRIVGVMHAKGVYDEALTDVRLCSMLEHTEGDNSYRAFLGRGIDNRQLLTELRMIIGQN